MRFSRTFLSLSLLFLAFSLSSETFAKQKNKQPKRFPLGCNAVGYSMDDSNLTLQPFVVDSPQTIYFIHNISNKTIHLSAPAPEDALVAPDYDVDIDSNRWAAFAMDRNSLIFRCTLSSDNEEKTPVSCGTSLELCQYPCVRFAAHNGGNYWPSKNKDRQQTIYEVNRITGILLKNCPKDALPNA
jgi:hypothetical protein